MSANCARTYHLHLLTGPPGGARALTQYRAVSRGASTHRSVHSVRKACQSTATSGVTRATGCAGQGWDSSPIPEYVARHEIRRVDGSVSRIVNIFYSTYFMQRIFTPPPIGIGGRGIVFARFLSFFLSLFLCQQDYEKTAGQICMKFSGKVWSDHGTT